MCVLGVSVTWDGLEKGETVPIVGSMEASGCKYSGSLLPLALCICFLPPHVLGVLFPCPSHSLLLGCSAGLRDPHTDPSVTTPFTTAGKHFLWLLALLSSEHGLCHGSQLPSLETTGAGLCPVHF